MELEISGRKVSVTDRIREHAQEKMGHLSKFADRIQRTTITLIKDADDRVVEILIRVRRGKDIVAEAKAETFYKALDMAIDKAERQLSRLKERVKEHRDPHMPPVPEPLLGPEDEEKAEK